MWLLFLVVARADPVLQGVGLGVPTPAGWLRRRSSDLCGFSGFGGRGSGRGGSPTSPRHESGAVVQDGNTVMWGSDSAGEDMELRAALAASEVDS